MNKYTETFGIDISKDVFDCYGRITMVIHNLKISEKNSLSFLKTLKDNTLVVMEVKGYYHYRLPQLLYKQNVIVSVVNPL